MGTALDHENRLVLSMTERQVAQARELTAAFDQAEQEATPDTVAVTMPRSLAGILRQVAEVVGRGGTVIVQTVPEELTSTAAARVLGVSRPTLMKLVADGAIRAHKVGTHTRLRSKDVFAFKEGRRQEQLSAFRQLREMEDDLGVED